MSGEGLSLRALTVVEGGRGVLFGFVVVAAFVEMGRLMMVMGSRMMVRRRLLVVVGGRMLGRNCH